MKISEAQKIVEQTKNNYDQIASQWDATRQHLWPGLEHILEHVTDGNTVVDVGCGNARLLKLFDFVKVSYIGIDNSIELLRIAEKQHPKHSFVVGDMRSLPLDDEVADVVICIAALHHVPSRAYRKQALAEMCRILKPGGTVFMTNWHYSSKNFLQKMILGLPRAIFSSRYDVGDIFVPWQDQQQRYVHLFSQSGLATLLASTGFEAVTQRVQKVSKRGYSNLVTIAQKRYNKGT